MAWDKWKRFTRLFRRRMDTLVGVDFGYGAVKVAEVKMYGNTPYLRTFAIVETPRDHARGADGAPEGQDPSLDEDMLAGMLQRALSLSGVKTKDAVLAVGGRLIFMREIAFPKLPPEELAEAIKWDIPKYVPYEADSYEYDYAVTGRDSQTGDLRVLVVAAPKKEVRQLVQVARLAGLSPVAVDIEPLAIYRTLTGAENAMILDVGTMGTQISLFQQGNPVLTRLVPLGRPEIAAAIASEDGKGAAELEEIMEELGQEVRSTTQFFNLQNRQAFIDKVVVTGLENMENLVSVLRAKTGLPVTGHNPLSGMEISPSISASHVLKAGPQLTVAVGLAMRGDEP